MMDCKTLSPCNCTQKCFSGALYMKERTPEEKAALREN